MVHEKYHIEDEVHFVCVCPCYRIIRNSLYKNVMNKFPLFMEIDNIGDKYTFLMLKCQKEMANYVYEAWNTRKQMLMK